MKLVLTIETERGHLEDFCRSLHNSLIKNQDYKDNKIKSRWDLPSGVLELHIMGDELTDTLNIKMNDYTKRSGVNLRIARWPEEKACINCKHESALEGWGGGCSNSKCDMKSSYESREMTPPYVDFDHITLYTAYDGMERITEEWKNDKFDQVSKLIVLMIIRGATHDELIHAIRYSRVVIDSVKHHLNYKQAFIDHGISALIKKYADELISNGKESNGLRRRSTRYPWGRNGHQFQRAVGELVNLERIALLREKGLSEAEIAEIFGLSTSNLRRIAAHGRLEQRKANMKRVLELEADGYGVKEIADAMGLNENSIVAILKIDSIPSEERTYKIRALLEDIVAEHGYIDVCPGVETYFGVSRIKLNGAIDKLVEEKEYKIHYVKVEELGRPKRFSSVKILGGPGSTYDDMLAILGLKCESNE